MRIGGQAMIETSVQALISHFVHIYRHASEANGVGNLLPILRLKPSHHRSDWVMTRQGEIQAIPILSESQRFVVVDLREQQR